MLTCAIPTDRRDLPAAGQGIDLPIDAMCDHGRQNPGKEPWPGSNRLPWFGKFVPEPVGTERFGSPLSTPWVESPEALGWGKQGSQKFTELASVVMHAFSPSVPEAAGRSLGVQDQPDLHNELQASQGFIVRWTQSQKREGEGREESAPHICNPRTQEAVAGGLP